MSDFVLTSPQFPRVVRADLGTLHALTLIQPWAWAIAHAGKDVENRTWPPPAHLIGADLAIHAGAKRDAVQDTLCDLYEIDGVLTDPSHIAPEEAEARRDEGDRTLVEWPDDEDIVFSAVVCVARVVRIERRGEGRARFSPWYCGPVGWVLDNVRPLAAPVPCRGAQGLWRLPADVERAVRGQIR